MKMVIKNNEIIKALVTRQGAKRGTAHAVVEYRADHNCVTGYKYVRALTETLFPSKASERAIEVYGDLVYGRPIAGLNAPKVEGMRDKNGDTKSSK